jgi:GNAT superfamily N-acetyltransferase
VADVRIRPACREDLPRIVELLAEDDLSRGREHPGEDLSPSADAFMDIEEDPRNELIVVEAEGEVIAILQLTFIPSLTHTGGERGQVEGVRVAAGSRGTGVGRQFLEWAISRAQKRGCKNGPAHHGQTPRRCQSLLRSVRLQGNPRKHEAEAQVDHRIVEERGTCPVLTPAAGLLSRPL